MLTIAAALEPELDGLGSILDSLWRSSGDNGLPVGPAPYRLAALGMGRDATISLRNLLAQDILEGFNNPGDALLLVGVAGALDSKLDTGDLVLPTRYYVHVQDSGQDRVQLGNQTAVQGEFAEPDSHLWRLARQAARQAGLSSHRLDSVTTSGIVSEPEEREALRLGYDAGVVDMEDYWVAQAAAQHRIPLVVARVVLDRAGQRLPDYLPSLSRRDRRSAALAVAARPWDFPALLKLGRQAKQAQRSLGKFVQAFAPLVWGVDAILDNWAPLPGNSWE